MSELKDDNKLQHFYGYSLLELSIVLLIMSYFMFSFSKIITVYHYRKLQETSKERLNIIEENIVKYYLKYGKFPCPAPADISYKSEIYARINPNEQNCSAKIINSASNILYQGDIPAITLGLSARYAEDGFGNKFRYIISKNLTSYSSQDDHYYHKTNLTLKRGENFLTDDLIYLIISHGQNGKGAYNLAGKQNIVSNNEAELENSDNDKVFNYQHKSNNFDDILSFKTKSQFLINLANSNYRYFEQDCLNEELTERLKKLCLAH